MKKELLVELKRMEIMEMVKNSGYTLSEIARRMGVKPVNLLSKLPRLKRLESLEKIEKKIKEVIK